MPVRINYTDQNNVNIHFILYHNYSRWFTKRSHSYRGCVWSNRPLSHGDWCHIFLGKEEDKVSTLQGVIFKFSLFKIHDETKICNQGNFDEEHKYFCI